MPKVKLRERTGKELLSDYNRHLVEIVQRHDGDQSQLDAVDQKRTINLRETCDYYIKLDSMIIPFVTCKILSLRSLPLSIYYNC